MIFTLGACSNVAGPTGQNPDVASVRENQDDGGQDTQGRGLPQGRGERDEADVSLYTTTC